jgi:hypothetical protein
MQNQVLFNHENPTGTLGVLIAFYAIPRELSGVLTSLNNINSFTYEIRVLFSLESEIGSDFLTLRYLKLEAPSSWILRM